MPWVAAAGAVVGGIAATAMSSDAPAAPDYTGAAQASSQSSKELTNINNYANRPTQNNPMGSVSWEVNPFVDPATGQTVSAWTQNTALTPEAQAAFDSQLAMQRGRTDLANGLMPQAAEAINTPIDYDSFSSMGTTPTASNFQNLGPAQNMQTAFESRYDLPGQFKAENLPAMPTFDRGFVDSQLNEALNYMRPDQERSAASLETKLTNQGLTRGSEAYNNAYRQMMDQQSRDKYNALTTAYQQGNQMFNNQLSANNQAFGQQNTSWNNNFNLGNTAFNQAYNQATFGNNARAANYQNNLRQQQIAEAQMRQLQPLNQINALTSGQQVAMPTFPSFNANQAAQPVNYLGAANAQGNYNLQSTAMNNASANSTTQGAFGLGGSLAGSYMSSQK